ncbi:MAG TPA: ribosomal protein S18-alanine N-acetyltransferase [Pyrinomonadaceae bacterium]|nr:ribosomal protein S18-alanine N-acetyltransferase [Pyrinomonadaceae bacterium]
MTEHDLLAVVELEETCGLSRWGWEAYYHEIAQGRGALMMVARTASGEEPTATDGLAGFIAARFTGDEVHINNVAVAHHFRRRGIGAALLGRVLKEGRALGARSAILEVRASNVAAQALYSRLGFVRVGLRRAYYTDPPEDALVMTASI